jgi:mannose-6-phosphate isomerase-like protein (cupin superfamily)
MTVELDVGHPIVLVAGEGEVIGDSPERRVEILCDRDELCVTWSRFGPGRDGASPHVHRHHTDLFYVLDGELTIGLGAERQETAVPAGSLVVAPPLVVHAFRNASATEEVRYLNFHAPGGGFADYLRGVTPGFDSEDPPADGGRPVEEALIVPADEGPLLVDRDEIRIEVRGAPRPASNRLTCLYALEDGRLLEIRA